MFLYMLKMCLIEICQYKPISLKYLVLAHVPFYDYKSNRKIVIKICIQIMWLYVYIYISTSLLLASSIRFCCYRLTKNKASSWILACCCYFTSGCHSRTSPIYRPSTLYPSLATHHLSHFTVSRRTMRLSHFHMILCQFSPREHVSTFK